MRRSWFSPRVVFRSLRTRNYRLYVAGSAVSVCGTWAQRVGQDWLVLQLTGSGVALGIATALQFVPVLLAGLWGGTIVDRVDRRVLLLFTQATQAVLALALGGLTMGGVVSVWMVYLLALLLGCVTVFDSPGRQAFVADMVPPENVLNAQALYSSVHNGGRLMGPAVAGLLVTLVGIATTFLLNAASFVAVLTALWLIDTSRLRSAPRVAQPALKSAAEALRYVRRHPTLWTSLVLVAVVAIFGQNFRVVLPLLAKDTLQQGAQTYGYLTTALGAGAVAGALATATRSRPTATSLLLACLAFGAANLANTATSVFGVVLGGMVLLGVTNIAFNTYARSLLLLSSDPHIRGRVISLHTLIFLGGRVAGGPLMGWVCTRWGARLGLAIAGGTAICAALAVLMFSRGFARSIDAGAQPRGTELGDTGPA